MVARAVEVVVSRRDVGVNTVFLPGINTVHQDRLKRRKKVRLRVRQSGPTVALVSVGDLASCVDANNPFVIALRHRQKRPRNVKFSNPTVIGTGGCAIPRTVPITAELAFWEDRSVGNTVAQVQLKEKSVPALP